MSQERNVKEICVYMYQCYIPYKTEVLGLCWNDARFLLHVLGLCRVFAGFKLVFVRFLPDKKLSQI